MPEQLYEDILERIRLGKVTKGDLDLIADELKDPNFESDLCGLLDLLGEANDLALPYKPLVEGFLNNQRQIIADKALRVLTMSWGLVHDCYRPIERYS